MANSDVFGKGLKKGGWRKTSSEGDLVVDQGGAAPGYEGARLLVKGKTEYWS